MADFVWGDAGGQLTPDQIAAQRKIAAALMKQGMDYSPVQSWTQGAARVAQALLGGYEDREADTATKTNAAKDAATIAALVGSGAPDASTAVTAASPATAVPAAVSGVAALAPLDLTTPSVKGDFISSIAPDAEKASVATGVDPRIIEAQAALESGYGQHAPGNNLFGIKSHGVPGGNNLATTEVVNGQPVQTNASFRSYASPSDSVAGYADFINSNPRYAALKNAQGLDAQTQALGQSGYATDPNYAAKVRQIALSLPDAGALPTDATSAVGQLPPGVTAPAGPATPQDTGAPVQMAQASPQAASPVSPAAIPAQTAPTPAAPAAPSASRAKLAPILAAMTSPYASDTTKKIAAIMLTKQLDSDKVKTVDLGGSIGVMDDRGNVIRTIAKGEPVKGPQFTVTGQDQFGNKTYGWVDPRTQTVTNQPATVNAASNPSALADVHGEDFLTQLQNQDPAVASQVRAIVEGRAPYPTGMLLKTPYGQKLAQFVTQADPTFESGNPAARTKMQADAATGKLAQNNNALNTAIGHLGELSDAAAKLNNGDYPSLNYIENAVSTQTGGTARTNFNTIRDKVAEEFTRVYRGAGGSESDIKREVDNLSSSNSPAQLHEAIAHMAELAQSKIDANAEQYKTTMGPLAKPRPMVSDKTAKTLELLRQRAAGKPADTAPVTKTINGKTYIQQNGQWFEQ